MSAHLGTVCAGLGFAEAPRWHDGKLWVSDMATHEVLTIDADGNITAVCIVSATPSGLGWLPDGRLLIVSMHDRKLLRLDGGELVEHADLNGVAPADLNDMVVDARGRAYVDNFGYDATIGEAPATTSMTLVHPDGRAEMQPGELLRPNGCAITEDGRRLVVAETRVHRLSTFDVARDGTFSNGRISAVLPSGTWADGMCLDANDAAWVADPKGRHCFHVSADGRLLEVIDTSPHQAIACVLGGDDRRTLYITLGNIRPWPEMAANRLARTDAYRVDVPGAGWP